MIDGLVAKLKDAGKKDTDLGGQLKGSTSCLEKFEKNIYEAQVTDIVEKLSAHSSCTCNYVGPFESDAGRCGHGRQGQGGQDMPRSRG